MKFKEMIIPKKFFASTQPVYALPTSAFSTDAPTGVETCPHGNLLSFGRKGWK